LSQEEFAARCGLDRTYISGIERGRRNPSLRNIRKIAIELSVSLSELFKGLR
jgi:transcriptional regulator with XRE-family HTH domain